MLSKIRVLEEKRIEKSIRKTRPPIRE